MQLQTNYPLALVLHSGYRIGEDKILGLLAVASTLLFFSADRSLCFFQFFVRRTWANHDKLRAHWMCSSAVRLVRYIIVGIHFVRGAPAALGFFCCTSIQCSTAIGTVPSSQSRCVFCRHLTWHLTLIWQVITPRWAALIFSSVGGAMTMVKGMGISVARKRAYVTWECAQYKLRSFQVNTYDVYHYQ